MLLFLPQHCKLQGQNIFGDAAWICIFEVPLNHFLPELVPGNLYLMVKTITSCTCSLKPIIHGFESMVNGRKDFISFLHRRVQGLRTTCRLSRCSFFMITGAPTFLQKLWVQTFLDIVLAGSLGTLQRTKFSAALAEKQFIHPPEKIN